MMLQILLNHLFRAVACAPGSISDGPEVSPPVSFAEGQGILVAASETFAL